MGCFVSLWLLSAVSLASHLNPIKRQRGQTGLKKCRDYANPAAPWRVPWIDRMVQRVTKGHLPPRAAPATLGQIGNWYPGRFCNQVLACRCYGKMRGSELSHSEASLPPEAILPSGWERWSPGSLPPPPAPAIQPPPPPPRPARPALPPHSCSVMRPQGPATTSGLDPYPRR